MTWNNLLTAVRLMALPALLTGVASAVINESDAHENHAPLPTKGVTIAGDTIMLSDRAREAIGLTTEKIGFGDIHRTVTVNARVELPWYAQAMITCLVPGKIDAVLVRPGEAIRAGQELARVVSTELDSVQFALLQAKSQFELAHKLVDQRAALDQQGIIAGKSLLESQAHLAEVSAAFQIVRQKLLALGLDEAALQQVEQRNEPLPYVPIVSPVGGVITHADIRIGQAVGPTDHLYHVVDPTTLWIVGHVLESDVRLLVAGQEVVAQFAALPGENFAGQIDHLRMAMDPQTRTQAVVIAVDNSTGRLRPGMFGRACISVQVVEEGIVCPVDAVIRSRTGDYVLVQRMPGKYENRPVKLGLAEDAHVEILGGVFPGDQVVVVGNSLLAALLGNQHKARIDDTLVSTEPAQDSQQGVVAVAHGFVELPTGHQGLATSQVEGRIRRILVQPSQQVAQGQNLAEIDSLQQRSVQLDLLQTLTQARLLERSLKRLARLHDQGLVAKRQQWEQQGEFELLSLQAAVQARKLVYFGMEQDAVEELKQVDLLRTESLAELVQTVPVRAPVSGHITGFHVVPGQVVNPAEPLFEIHDLATVWVKGFVHERDASRVQLEQPVRVRFAAYPDLEASGKVARISPLMHDTMQVLPVWVEVSNPDQLLKTGMLARMTIMDDAASAGRPADIARLHPIAPAK